MTERSIKKEKVNRSRKKYPKIIPHPRIFDSRKGQIMKYFKEYLSCVGSIKNQLCSNTYLPINVKS